jgi:hypothetical protein
MTTGPLNGAPSDRYGKLFPSLDEALANSLDGVLRESLAAKPRPEPA